MSAPGPVPAWFDLWVDSKPVLQVKTRNQHAAVFRKAACGKTYFET
jgi:hypothetical protein